MPLDNPIVIYHASTNMEAQFLCDLLGQAGIEAHVTEQLNEFACPQLWVDAQDAENAGRVVAQYEDNVQFRKEAEAKIECAPEEDVIGVRCPGCGQESWFPGALEHSVQSCPHCDEYVDVEAVEEA